MRWQQGHHSDDVIDLRGQRSVGGAGLRLGIGGFLVLAVLSVVFRRNLFTVVQNTRSPTTTTPTAPYRASPEEERQAQFVAFVLDDVQNTWGRLTPSLGTEYRRAQLVLFTDAVRSGCGAAGAEVGPFYCPADQRVYLDLGFFRELQSRFRASGDFAQAYVIAHEIGHHVQHQLGIDARVRQMQQADPSSENSLSVRTELQADCFAGVWAHSTSQRNLLESGDLEEALGAAAAVGDDRIQRGAGRRSSPETWTHGSAEQRASWFRRGWDSGDPRRCDTFAGT